MDGVQVLLIIGAGIAISAVAKKRPRTRADHRDPGRGGLVHPRGAAQGTTIRWVTRRLKFDLSAERAEEERLREAGRQIVADAAADLDASFEAQRRALGTAVNEHRLTEEVARSMIEDLDLRQAARHTVPPPGGSQGQPIPG